MSRAGGGAPPEITDDLFRALAPYLNTDYANASIAMPLIGTGDQGFPPALMMRTILGTTVSWMKRGLALRLLKIVVFSDVAAESARAAFAKFIEGLETKDRDVNGIRDALEEGGGSGSYDLFMSYSHRDSETAEFVIKRVRHACPNAQIFYDRRTLRPGVSWLMQIADSLDASRRVAALYTPHYWSSASCKDEFSAALARQNDTGDSILFPVYVNTAQVPYLFRNLQYLDCREGDSKKLAAACNELAASLAS